MSSLTESAQLTAVERIRITKVCNLYNMDKQYDEEAELLRDVKDFLDMLPRCKIVRQEAGTRSGIGDIIVCYHGRFVGIELKDKTGTPSPQQLLWIAKIREAGGKADICRTLSDVMQLLSFSLI